MNDEKSLYLIELTFLLIKFTFFTRFVGLKFLNCIPIAICLINKIV